MGRKAQANGSVRELTQAKVPPLPLAPVTLFAVVQSHTYKTSRNIPEGFVSTTHPSLPNPQRIYQVWPVEVRCTTAPPREVEGLLASFTLDGAVYSISHVSGPERIAGMWWEGRNKTRDYFDVEDSTGRRFWVFRVAETRRWFLHGFFDG